LAKPDNRRDNVKKLQEMTQSTIENCHEAKETLNNPDISDQQRAAIEAKNKRREEAIEGFRSEIKDEHHDQFE
jgi:small acid-soluble spore protein (thioredoxin-like protein)